MSLLSRSTSLSALLILLFGCSDQGGGGSLDGSAGGADASGGSQAAPPGGTGASAAGGSGEAPGSGPILGIPDLLEDPNWSVQGITTWRHGAQAAYTIFHDDLCDPVVDHQFDIADPELTERGLVASFGAVAMYCGDRDLWSRVETLRSHGHEIVNHSWSHANLTEASVDLAQEIDAARAAFEMNLTDFEMSFFIFPYDAFNGGLVQHLKDDGYLGTRAGNRGHNAPNFQDDFAVDFDVFGPGYSVYVGQGACAAASPGDSWDMASDACREYVLSQYLSDVIADGGWGVRELHSIEGEAWEPVPRALYESHLDELSSRQDAGELWVATASDVLRYRRGRDACALPVVSADALYFKEPTLECRRYATELTFHLESLAGGAARRPLDKEVRR